MEHLFHIFGGGCGEHLVLPLLGSLGVGLVLARTFIVTKVKSLNKRLRRGSNRPPVA